MHSSSENSMKNELASLGKKLEEIQNKKQSKGTNFSSLKKFNIICEHRESQR